MPDSTEYKPEEKVGVGVTPVVLEDTSSQEKSTDEPKERQPSHGHVPLKWKLTSILLVSAIGFGSHWSSGITGAMKSTLKKELHINNTQYALLEASEDFMVTALILASGVVTDRIGGAGITHIISLETLTNMIRGYCVREHHLYHRLNLGGCCSSSPVFQVYGWWKSHPCPR